MFALLFLIPSVLGQEVMTIAGNGVTGARDGEASLASFSRPVSVDIDSFGNIYIADYDNHKIRKISPEGIVSTFAGAGIPGNSDGIGEAALFKFPTGIAIDSKDQIYVADFANNKIRKISLDGNVTTFAGTEHSGLMDGIGPLASFYGPIELAVDVNDHLYVADYYNNQVRKISPKGHVTTFGKSSFTFWPLGVAVDSHGNVFVTDAGEGRILKIEPSGTISVFAGNGTVGNVDGPGHLASFNRPSGLAIDDENHLFVADSFNQEIRMISPEGEVTTVTQMKSRIPAPFVTEPEASVGPVSIAIDHDGHILVTDVGENQVRMVSICVSGEIFNETTQQCEFIHDDPFFFDEWLFDDDE